VDRGSAEGARIVTENHTAQCGENADIVLLKPDELQRQFPWLEMDDVALGSFGRSGEGWFDGYGLMQAFRQKARSQECAAD
jgi:FAD-dependent oxidoreductase domain-containing protein 1